MHPFCRYAESTLVCLKQTRLLSHKVSMVVRKKRLDVGQYEFGSLNLVPGQNA